MRTVVLGALALGSGCNWVFGLDPVRLTDAEIVDAVPDARLPTVRLSAITPTLTDTGGIMRQATFGPILPAPTVQYGKIGEPLIDSVIEGEDVWVGYDLAEATAPWRLVYTLQGGIPHEVIWKPSASMHPGRAATLQLTPNDRDEVPAGAMFHLAATGAPTTWIAPRVYTTNAWTITPSPSVDGTTPSQINVAYAGPFTTAIAGHKRKPDPLKDYEALLEYDTSTANPACYVARGSAVFRIDLATGTSPDAAAPVWTNMTKVGDWTVKLIESDLEIVTNMVIAHGLAGVSSVKKLQFITYGPGGGIPLYQQTENAELQDDPVPVPVGILLAKCVNGPETVPAFAYPSRAGQATIGTIAYATTPIQLADGGPSVRNLLESSIVGDDGPFNMTFNRSAFPTDPTIDTTAVRLEPGGSTVAIPSSTATTASLDFSFSVGNPVIDVYEATLYRIDGTNLIPLREFTFTEKPMPFDRATGQPAGTRYVFGIRILRGMAVSPENGDFTKWNDTQTLGLTYTQAFTLD